MENAIFDAKKKAMKGKMVGRQQSPTSIWISRSFTKGDYSHCSCKDLRVKGFFPLLVVSPESIIGNTSKNVPGKQ